MKKIIILLGVLIICTVVIFSQDKESVNEESVNGLVLYKSEVSSYGTLKTYLSTELGVNLEIDYAVDDSEIINDSDFWEYSRIQLTNKLKNNNVDLLLDIPNEYLRDYIENESLLKLDDYINIDTIHPAVVDKSRKIGNGSIYFISPYFSSDFLMVNTKLFDELKVPIPSEIKFWQDVPKILSNIKTSIEDNGIEDIYPLSLGMNGIESFFQDFEVLTAPLDLSIKSGRNIYGDERWLSVFSFFMDLYKEYGVHETIDTMDMFLDDKIVMKFVQGPEIMRYKDFMDKYKIFEVPSYEGFEDKVFLNTTDISIPLNAPNKENALNVLNHFFSKEFANKGIKSRLFGIYPFVSYVDDGILDKYRELYNLNEPSVIYSDKPGYANKHEFILFNDYFNYQEVQREVVPDIIRGNISIEDGFHKIKSKYLDYSDLE